MRDGCVREVEARLVQQVVAQIRVRVYRVACWCVVGALVRVRPVEVRNVCEAAGVEENAGVGGDYVAILY